MTKTDDELILLCAVRYAQGRRSYIVSSACNWVRDRWPSLSAGTRDVIKRDLSRFLELGDKCPEVLGKWRSLARWIERHQKGLQL